MSNVTQSHRWKQLERDVAEMFGGQRVLRDLYESEPDVIVDAGPYRLLVECKAWQRFKHHAIIETCRAKYCAKGETPALATRERNGRTYVTVEAHVFAELLQIARELHAMDRTA